MTASAEPLRNWSGNHVYSASRVHRPGSLDELRSVVSEARRLRALGSRHSFTAIGDAAELVAFDAITPFAELSRDRGAVTVGPGVTYAQLSVVLRREGLALANLASLPHISVLGAVSTGTHGSGDRLGGLATAVRSLQLVTSSGDLVTRARGEPGFDGCVVGLGALGVLWRATLDVEPGYAVAQRVYLDLGWDALEAHFDEVFAAGDSVSAFHRFGASVAQVWVKRRVRPDDADAPSELFGAPAATRPVHPVLGGDPGSCTVQLGRRGPWFERLPHFRSEFTPSAGEEIQSEWLVARADAPAALGAVRALGSQLAPLALTCEIRTVPADPLWLSMSHARDSVALHFTWRRDPAAVERAATLIEDALAPLGARPHWGKAFTADANVLAARYPRLGDFVKLRDELDPRGGFVTAWLRRYVLGAA